MTRRLAAALVLAAGLLQCPFGAAQTGAPSAGVVSPPPTVRYEDRLIDAGTIAPDDEASGTAFNPEGWARD